MQQRDSSAYRPDLYEFSYPDGSGTYYWHLARKLLVRRKLLELGLHAGRILDVGCGTGGVVEYLRRARFDCFGSDLSQPPVVRDARAYVFTGVDALELPMAFRETVDALLLLDVLEHLRAPQAFLRSAKRRFPRLKSIIATVPAGWSNYDEHFGHVVRYDPESIARVFNEAALCVREVGFFFHSLYWPLRLSLLLSRSRGVAVAVPKYPSVHRIAATLFDVEQQLVPRTWRGTSVLVIAAV
jgi:SAM-dependent methyltransferase